MVLLLPAAFALTASIGNPRAVIRTEGSPEDPTTLERTLMISNKNDIPVKVTLTPDLVMRHFISGYDSEFILDPGQSKDVPYTLTIDRGGTFEAKINVGFWPADEGTGGNGAGLAAALIIISEGPEIAFPPETENQSIFNPPPIKVVPGDPDKLTNSTVSVSQDNFIEPDVPDAPEKPVHATGNTAKDDARARGPSPIAGIIIIALVVGVGLAAYVYVRRK